jgi:uncharacterized membrane protein
MPPSSSGLPREGEVREPHRTPLDAAEPKSVAGAAIARGATEGRARPRASPRPVVVGRHPALFPVIGAYALVLFLWSFLRHRHFGSAAIDLGAYQSVFWNLAFKGTPWNSLERAHQWSIHFEVGLSWIALLYRIRPSPIWLFAIQSAATAAIAIPIDALARRITGDRVIGVVCALAALLTPQIFLGTLTDFHSIVLCALPMAIVAWAVEADSSRTIALASLGAILLREQMGLFVAAAAVAWFLRHGNKRLIPAIALAIIGVSAFALELFVLIPAFGSGQSYHYVAHYRTLGGSAGEAASRIGSDPLKILAFAVDARRGRFLLEMVSGGLPLLALSLRSLRKTAWPIVMALPQLAIQLLSDQWQKWDIHYQYGVPAAALAAAACVLSLRFIPREYHLRRVAALGWLALVIAHGARVFPSPVGPAGPIDPTFDRSSRIVALRRALKEVPQEASISAQENVVPHVGDRAEVHVWPDGQYTDDFILLDAGGPARNVRDRRMLIHEIIRLRSDPAFERRIDDAGVILARRLPVEEQAPRPAPP